MNDLQKQDASLPAEVEAIRAKLMEGRERAAVFAPGIGKCERQIRNYVREGMPHEYIGCTLYIVVDPAIEWLRKRRQRNAAPRGRGRPRKQETA